MSENTEQTDRSWPRYVAWAMVMFVVYPLSYGPFIWLACKVDGDPYQKSYADYAMIGIRSTIYVPLDFVWLDLGIGKEQMHQYELLWMPYDESNERISIGPVD